MTRITNSARTALRVAVLAAATAIVGTLIALAALHTGGRPTVNVHTAADDPTTTAVTVEPATSTPPTTSAPDPTTTVVAPTVAPTTVPTVTAAAAPAPPPTITNRPALASTAPPASQTGTTMATTAATTPATLAPPPVVPIPQCLYARNGSTANPSTTPEVPGQQPFNMVCTTPDGKIFKP